MAVVRLRSNRPRNKINMERRKKLEIVGSILLLIALVVFLWWLLTKDTIDTSPLPSTTAGQIIEPTAVTVEPIPPHVAVTTASTIARVFVERLGSFSSESGYTNIDDVMIMASDSLQNELKNLKEKAIKSQGDSYYGVSTRVISLKVESETESTASIKITTSRTESVNDPLSKEVRNQEIVLNLVKSDNTWLVEDYFWQE